MAYFDRIEYTVHARLRMVVRSISEDVVTDVLSAPDQTFLDGEEYVAERIDAENKAWRVIYVPHEESDRDVRVVSVYRIRKLKAL